MSKRHGFIALSLILTLGLALLQRVDANFRPLAGVGLSLFSSLLTFLILRKEIQKIEYLTVLTPPFLLTLSFSLIIYFFPNFNVYFLSLVYLSFGISFYSCLLSCNIFCAAAAKKLLLLKPAQTTFLFIILSIFFLLNTHIFKTSFFLLIQNGLSFLLAALLAFLIFWAQGLNQTLKLTLKKQQESAFLVAVTVFLTSWGINLLPLEHFFRSLVITAVFNAVLGVFISKIHRQTNNRIIIEYLTIPIIVLLFSLIL